MMEYPMRSAKRLMDNDCVLAGLFLALIVFVFPIVLVIAIRVWVAIFEWGLPVR
jgi:hypothetical protein